MRSPRPSARRLTTWIAQVLGYCERSRGEPLSTTDEANADENRKQTADIGEWDQHFITIDQEMFEIILAANYLDVKSLLCVVSLSTRVALGFLILLRSDVGCKTVANMIPGKSFEEVMKLFNIVNGFTPEGRYVAQHIRRFSRCCLARVRIGS